MQAPEVRLLQSAFGLLLRRVLERDEARRREKTRVHGSNPPRFLACACLGTHRDAPGEARACLATGKAGTAAAQHKRPRV